MKKISYAYVLSLRKICRSSNPTHTMFKNIKHPSIEELSIKSHNCPKLRKMRKVLDNNEQWMQIFFLVHLSNKEPRKNKRNPSPEQYQGDMFH
jgi:hypothetical protein